MLRADFCFGQQWLNGMTWNIASEQVEQSQETVALVKARCKLPFVDLSGPLSQMCGSSH